MKTLIVSNTQEEVVREYLDAFKTHNVNRMLDLVDPAVHYERSVDGKLETILNGSADFKAHVSESCQFDERTLKLTELKSDHEFVRIEFSILMRDLSWQELKGYAVFWFMEHKIIQLIIRVEAVAAH